MTVNLTCPFCGKNHSVIITYKGFQAWANGALIQDAMPDLSSTEREQLISNICPTCQAGIFGADDEYFFPDEDGFLEEDDL